VFQPLIELDQFPFTADEGVVLRIEPLKTVSQLRVICSLSFQCIQGFQLILKFCPAKSPGSKTALRIQLRLTYVGKLSLLSIWGR